MARTCACVHSPTVPTAATHAMQTSIRCGEAAGQRMLGASARARMLAAASARCFERPLCRHARRACKPSHHEPPPFRHRLALSLSMYVLPACVGWGHDVRIGQPPVRPALLAAWGGVIQPPSAPAATNSRFQRWQRFWCMCTPIPVACAPVRMGVQIPTAALIMRRCAWMDGGGGGHEGHTAYHTRCRLPASLMTHAWVMQPQTPLQVATVEQAAVLGCGCANVFTAQVLASMLAPGHACHTVHPFSLHRRRNARQARCMPDVC